MALGKDLVEVLLDRPGCAHPPGWHLINNYVGPEKLRHFFAQVVAVVDMGGLQGKARPVEKTLRGGVQGVVVAPLGMSELFAAVQ